MALSRKKKKTDKLLDDLDRSTTKALRMMLKMDVAAVKRVMKAPKAVKVVKKLNTKVKRKKIAKSPKKGKAPAKK